MTILGQHTVAETFDLIAALDFRVNKDSEQWLKVQKARTGPPTPERARLDGDMMSFIAKWGSVRDKQKTMLRILNASNPLVPSDTIPAEPNFRAVDDCFRVDVPHFKDIEQRLDAEAKALGLPETDLSGMPKQDSVDADFNALQKVDKVIKTGEDASKGATKAVGSGLLAHPGIVLGGIAALLGAGYVVKKVYL